MDLKVTGKCFVQEGSGLVMDEAGSGLQAKCVLLCKMMPSVITKDGDIDKFKGGEMDAIYQADDQYFDLFDKQVMVLQAQKSQVIITSVFSPHKF